MLMKKEYLSPEALEVLLETRELICGSVQGNSIDDVTIESEIPFV